MVTYLRLNYLGFTRVYIHRGALIEGNNNIALKSRCPSPQSKGGGGGGGAGTFPSSRY